MQKRTERILLETPRHRITGTLTLARDGFRSRVSDLLNATEREFVSLTDVELESIEDGSVERHEFMAVSRRHVIYAVVLSGAPVAGL